MTGNSSKRDDKAERLAEALRANLQRRKAQARERKAGDSDGGDKEPPAR